MVLLHKVINVILHTWQQTSWTTWSRGISVAQPGYLPGDSHGSFVACGTSMHGYSLTISDYKYGSRQEIPSRILYQRHVPENACTWLEITITDHLRRGRSEILKSETVFPDNPLYQEFKRLFALILQSATSSTSVLPLNSDQGILQFCSIVSSGKA